MPTIDENIELICDALKAAPALDTAVARSLVRWLIRSVCAAAFDGVPDARVLRVGGGWVDLSRILFRGDVSFADELRNAAWALCSAQVITTTSASRGMPSGIATGMITFGEAGSEDGLSGAVSFMVGSVLVPHEVIVAERKRGGR